MTTPCVNLLDLVEHSEYDYFYSDDSYEEKGIVNLLDLCDHEGEYQLGIDDEEERARWHSYNEEQRRQKRELSVRMCGLPMWRTAPATGGRMRVIHHCGYRDDCERCRLMFAEKYRDRVINGFTSLTINQVTVADDDGWKKLHGELINIARELQATNPTDETINASDYLRLPNEDGSYTVFTNLPITNAKKINAQEISAMDWLTLTSKQNGKRITGDLGRENKPASDDTNLVSIYITDVYVTHNGKEVDPALVNSLHTAACLETADLDPKTAEEIQSALDKRDEAFFRILRAQGYKLDIIKSKRKIAPIFNWRLNIDAILKHKARKKELDDLIRANQTLQRTN
jgi:hypothetical protein